MTLRGAPTPRWIGLTILFGVGLVLTSLPDRAVWHWAQANRAETREWEWLQVLRFAGDIRFWLVAALALVLNDRALLRGWPWRYWSARGGLLLMSAGLGGLVTPVLQVIVRRQRPEVADGAYSFRPFYESPLDASGLALPSGHAAVAAAGAFMLWHLQPRLWPVCLLLAIGCAAQRVVSTAHFVSDTYVSLWLGALVSVWLMALHRRLHRNDPRLLAPVPVEPLRIAGLPVQHQDRRPR
jgi:membrane-associated phospholipid phosphatase